MRLINRDNLTFNGILPADGRWIKRSQFPALFDALANSEYYTNIGDEIRLPNIENIPSKPGRMAVAHKIAAENIAGMPVGHIFTYFLKE